MLKNRKLNHLGIFSILLSLVFVTGCQAKPQKATIANYKGAELENSIYIKKDVDTFQKLYTPKNGSVNSEFLWETGEDDLIPHIEPGDELILHTVAAIPETLTLISMRNFGYTAGMRVYPDNEKDVSYYTINDDAKSWCPGSVLKDFWKQHLGDFKNVRLEAISGLEFDSNRVSNLNFIKGLDANLIYEVSFYKGTEYRTLNTKADTHVFVVDKKYNLKNYSETQNIYFTISLPKNMEEGYWLIEDFGMFYLDANVDLTGADAVEINEIVDVNIDDSQELLELPDVPDEDIPANPAEDPEVPEDPETPADENVEPLPEEPAATN